MICGSQKVTANFIGRRRAHVPRMTGALRTFASRPIA